MDFHVRAKPKPSSYIIYINNSSICVLATDPNNNKTIIQTTTNNRTTKKKRKQFVLTNRSNKKIKNSKQILIEVRIKNLQVVKTFYFLYEMCLSYTVQNNSRKLRIKVH